MWFLLAERVLFMQTFSFVLPFASSLEFQLEGRKEDWGERRSSRHYQLRGGVAKSIFKGF
jgi:hypothetical protein